MAFDLILDLDIEIWNLFVPILRSGGACNLLFPACPGHAFILAELVSPKGRMHRFIGCQFKTISHNPANFTRLLDYVKGIGLG